MRRLFCISDNDIFILDPFKFTLLDQINFNPQNVERKGHFHWYCNETVIFHKKFLCVLFTNRRSSGINQQIDVFAQLWDITPLGLTKRKNEDDEKDVPVCEIALSKAYGSNTNAFSEFSSASMCKGDDRDNTVIVHVRKSIGVFSVPDLKLIVHRDFDLEFWKLERYSNDVVLCGSWGGSKVLMYNWRKKMLLKTLDVDVTTLKLIKLSSLLGDEKLKDRLLLVGNHYNGIFDLKKGKMIFKESTSSTMNRKVGYIKGRTFASCSNAAKIRLYKFNKDFSKVSEKEIKGVENTDSISFAVLNEKEVVFCRKETYGGTQCLFLLNIETGKAKMMFRPNFKSAVRISVIHIEENIRSEYEDDDLKERCEFLIEKFSSFEISTGKKRIDILRTLIVEN